MKRRGAHGASAVLASSLPAAVLVCIVLCFAGCGEGLFSPVETTEEIAAGNGLTGGTHGSLQAETGSMLFVENLKRDLPDTLGYPVDGAVTAAVNVDPSAGDAPALTWLPTDDEAASGVDQDGDGAPDYFPIEGNLFIETGTYDSETSAYTGMPLRLTGADVVLRSDGRIEGTAELPSFTDSGGFFSGLTWSDITPARMITATGAEIIALMEEAGSELTIPVLDDRTYFLFFLNGDITVAAEGGLEIELPEIEDVPTASFAFLLDASDPMFYVTYACDTGFLEDEEEPDEGQTDDAEEADGDPPNGASDKISQNGFLSFSGLSIEGVGWSLNGWIPMEREHTWPFNEDTLGNPRLNEDGSSNLFTGDPRSYVVGSGAYFPDFPTLSRVTYSEEGVVQRRIVSGEISDPSSYSSVTTLCNDPVSRLYHYDVEQLNHVFLVGEVPLQVAGIPAKITSVGFLLDPEDVMGEIDSLGSIDLPFRLVSNGSLDLFPKKSDEEPFFKIPEDFTGASVLAEHTANVNRLLFTISGNTADAELTDFIDLSQLGEIPDTGTGPATAQGSASAIIGEEMPTTFLEGIDAAWLDSLAHPMDAAFNIAGYLSFPPGPFECLYLANADYRIDPFSMINSALGTAIDGPTAQMHGAVMYGYPYGVYLAGFMDFSLPMIMVSTSGDSFLTAWFSSVDSWGFHFDTNLEAELFGGLGTVALEDARIDLNNEEFGLGGTFTLDASLPDTTASVSVNGLIDFVAPDYLLSGEADITLIGYELLEASMAIGYRSGVEMAGTLTIPGFSEISMEGSYSPATNDFTLGGSADITLFENLSGVPNIHLGGARVFFSNDGVSVAGSLQLPGTDAETVAVGGEIETNGDFRMFGTADLTIGGLSLVGAGVEFYNQGANCGIELNGEITVPELFTTRVHGELDLDQRRMSLSGVANVTIPGTGETLADADVEIVADIGMDGSFSNVQLRIGAGFSLGSFLSTRISTDNPNHLSISAGGTGVSVQGDVTGYARLGIPKVGFGFSVLGYDFELSASGSVHAYITLHLNTTDWSGNGFSINGTAEVKFKYPWVEEEWKEECETVLGVTACVWYPSLKFSTKTGTIRVRGGVSVRGSGVRFSVSLPVVGRKTISF